MRIDHPTTPFDADHEDDLELTQQFWGATRDWQPGTEPTQPTPRHSQAVEVVRDRLAAYRPRRRDTGSLARTRRHGVVTAEAPTSVRDATLGELGAGLTNDDLAVGHLADIGTRDDSNDWSDIPVADDPFATNRTSTSRRRSPEARTDVPLSGLAERLGVGEVDPRLVRLGLVALIAVLLVPLAFALRPAEPDSVRTVLPEPTPADSPATPIGAEPPSDPGVAPAAGASAPDAAPAGPDPTTVDGGAAAVESTSSGTSSGTPAPTEPAATAAVGDTSPAGVADTDATGVGDAPQDTVPEATASAATGIDDAATASAPAERLTPECPLAYTAGAGDSWFRIAEAAGVAPSELVELNLATFETPIFPGDEICLPSGATVPSPPTTAPATTAPATTAPATTAPPTTTPATTSPASASEVEQIIRDVWPDELEERALEIAWVESRYDPNAYNGWCCYGVFQIYWTVHQSWLDDYGIDEVNDLYDPRKNTEAAYALYRAAGGWGPWGG